MKSTILNIGSDNSRGICSNLQENKKHTQQTIIVEFNGLTGLGKTSVAKALIEELNKRGYKTVDSRFRYGFLDSIFRVFPELFSLKLYWNVKSFSNSIYPKKKRTHVKWVNYYARKYKSIEKHSNSDFAIIDEAIIQFIAAIAFNDRIPISNKVEAIVMKLKKMNINFVRVDCLPNIDVANNRIVSRPAKGLSVELMQDAERVQKLETEAANIDYLRSVFSNIYKNQQVITIDTTTANPIDNALVVMDRIIKIKNNNENTYSR